MRFAWKLFFALVVVAAIGLAVLVLRSFGTIAAVQDDEIERRVRADALFLARLVEATLADEGGPGLATGGGRPASPSALRVLTDGLARELEGPRFTVIAPDGVVLADTHEDPAVMENHRDRPELAAPGVVYERPSRTLGRRMVYCAFPVGPPGEPRLFARASLSSGDVEAEWAAVRSAVLQAAAAALAAALAAAFFLARRLALPLRGIGALLAALARGDYARRVPVVGDDEIDRLAAASNALADRLQDREARILAEVRQKDTILAAMEEGLLAVDDEEHVVLANEAARRLLSGRAEPVGRRLAEVTRLPEILEVTREALTRGERRTAEFTASPVAGPRVLQVTAGPVRDDRGAVTMVVLVLRDLTEMRRLETVRRDFVANVSHELKTPLTNMRGYLEAVHDDPEMPARQRERFLAKVWHSSQRLGAIVKDLLDLARIESGKPPRQPLDLSLVVSDCVEAISADAEERLVSVRLEGEGRPLLVLGDDPALATAVSNLIDNAVKYSPEGGQVVVRVERDDERGFVTVTDEGPGIPVHEQERIFERFYRVDKDRSRRLGGTGLGLSIVKNVVVAHGGEVSVESRVGRGSSFRILLPLASEGDLEDAEEEDDDADQPAGGGSGTVPAGENRVAGAPVPGPERPPR